MTNLNIIKLFLSKQKCNNKKNLSTDGVKLYSYNLKIAEWVGNGMVIFDYTAPHSFESMTTSNHVGLIKRKAPFWAEIVNPNDE